jgi:cystathionine beta-lyase
VLTRSARVALNAGRLYGAAYAGFVRVNLACEPVLLVEAVDRIVGALAQRSG